MRIAEYVAAPLFDPGSGQGARQFAELAIALLLSSLVGLERELQQKSAGLRTHTLVGVGSALFMEVSIHGFNAVAGLTAAQQDPSRVAAQIVSGIGFIGGGLIFVRRDAVRGLTTAATIWLTCAVGMACGGGLPLLGAAATLVHFLVVRGFPVVTRRLAMVPGDRVELRLSYRTRRGLLGRVLELCTKRGFRVTDVHIEPDPAADTREKGRCKEAGVVLSLEGKGSAYPLVEELMDWDGILGVGVRSAQDSTE
ncbi:MgtC/SapB family protein [Streptomyces sp. ISL-11]|uniref:MgtC/SapB family protein n=1 Tax=Streptomyces sp. ISL-11 TaxID=2819174 RepID=UPI001BE89E6C|nr:MgtC/SapB family protein [Streptomyces sp. ISL-11]MBT2383603.1 MgtC/SapB family protein [Streptomyces sp. ISL-11]